jgi:hypothetical protein
MGLSRARLPGHDSPGATPRARLPGQNHPQGVHHDRILGSLTALLTSVCISAPAANAQTTHHVGCSKIDIGSWTLTPIYSKTGTQVEHVVSFLAFAKPSAVVGSNLIAIWYQREGETWTSKSWETSDPWEVIASVKAVYEIPNSEDHLWGLPSGGEGVAVPETPKEYSAGLLLSDPAAGIILSSPDRDAIVDVLTAAGYSSANISLEDIDGIPMDVKLEGMALSSKYQIADCIGFPLGTTPASGATAQYGTYFISCQSPTVTPTGPWTVVGAGVADNAGNCNYTRPTARTRVCCIQYAGYTHCWTNPSTGTQTGSCANPVGAGAACPATPACTLPFPPQI